jgi:hypothetical protein
VPPKCLKFISQIYKVRIINHIRRSLGRHNVGNLPPSAIMPIAGPAESATTSASNKTVSDRAPSVYLKEVEKAAGSHLKDWLSSNLITEACFEAGRADDFGKFISLRADAIHNAIWAKTGWQPL